jgi:hypothetical protein
MVNRPSSHQADPSFDEKTKSGRSRLPSRSLQHLPNCRDEKNTSESLSVSPSPVGRLVTPLYSYRFRQSFVLSSCALEMPRTMGQRLWQIAVVKLLRRHISVIFTATVRLSLETLSFVHEPCRDESLLLLRSRTDMFCKLDRQHRRPWRGL